MFPNFAVLIATKRPLCRYVSLSITYVLSYRICPKKKIYIYIYIYIGGLCIDFSVYSARYVEVEPIYVAIGEKTGKLYFHPYKPVSLLLIHQGMLLLRIFVPNALGFVIPIK